MNTNAIKQALDELHESREAQLAAITRLKAQIRLSDAQVASAYTFARHCAIQAADGTGQSLEAAKNAEEALETQYARGAQALGLTASLHYVPQCGHCADQGILPDGSLCSCVFNRAAKELMGAAGLSDSARFDCFDLSLFDDESPLKSGVTQKGYMAQVLKLAQEYCRTFPHPTVPNLLFTGKSGLGKTFIMDCIGYELGLKGFGVLRSTAYKLNAQLARQLVGEGDMELFLNCDLLLIDDLGSEPKLNKVTVEGFFNLFNERLCAGKPFLLTTNMPPSALEERYGERVYSRLVDRRMSQVIHFDGQDVRRIKR